MREFIIEAYLDGWIIAFIRYRIGNGGTRSDEKYEIRRTFCIFWKRLYDRTIIITSSYFSLLPRTSLLSFLVHFLHLYIYSYFVLLLLFSPLLYHVHFYLFPPFDLFLYILATHAATYSVCNKLCLSLSHFHSCRSHVRLMTARVTYASTVRNANGGSLRAMIGGRCRFEDADITQDRYYPNIHCASNIIQGIGSSHKIRERESRNPKFEMFR